jgi:hypothetical protein
MRLGRTSLFVVFILLATPVLRAGVLVVDASGGGDFTTLSAAVAAAAGGDTILVHSGQYVEPAPVVIDGKTLYVTGYWSPGNPGAKLKPGIIVRNLQPGQRVVLQQLAITGSSASAGVAPGSALALLNNNSHVRVQSCGLVGGAGGSNPYPGGAAAVTVKDSLSSAFAGCTLSGGGGYIGGSGGVGLALDGGVLLMSASYALGGHGGGDGPGGVAQGGPGGGGIQHSSGVLFVVGGDMVGGDGGISFFGGDGGDGLSLGSAGHAWLMGGAVALYGQGAYGDNSSGEDGVPILDPSGLVTDYGGPVHGFDINSPVREGMGVTLGLLGGFDESTLLFVSPDPYLFPLPGYQGALMVSPTAMIGPFTLPPPGLGQVFVVAPMLPAALEVLHVYVQPAYAGIHGGAYLGTGRVLTILDSSL